ncbi:nucleoside-diphosphate kinase [Rhizobium sp. P32RR-XVIII]|uniref:nucleoside-diphosphate kinase n=1 Tax=Rhizobium sp. P32RR-XVIII TaxID=2726738 RepID=UPI0014574253|nr:nucleoside-diphosphate kinase [Rhizobium sp. P32RR-XVIII]NLS07839.1 nucleoside-diphosphate kinase [Rhizobium sp. P32RR-XVIII]
MREHCILTTRDFTLLEAILDDPFVRDTRLMPVLRRKITTAIVMFRQDLPENVASLNSRVTYRIDGARRDTRVLSDDRMTTAIGMLLPVTTLRGLALLGLAEGQEFVLTNVDGVEERILLETVHYQPERAMRRKAAASAQASAQDCQRRGPLPVRNGRDGRF